MKTQYIVLKRHSPNKPGPAGLAFKTTGADGSSKTYGVEVHAMDAQAAAHAAADPDIKVVARGMPTRLITPLAQSAAAAGAGSWGIGYTGADKSKYSGKGIRVAVLDTGIEASHPAFNGVMLTQKDFSGSGDGDHNGHGTHCAGTIFGRDVQGKRIGIARGVPQALIGKVLGNDGTGSSDMIFQALTWALQEKAHVISMSLGFDFPGMVDELVKDGWPADLATSNALEAYRGNLRMFDALMSMIKAQQAFGYSPLVIAAAGNESRRQVDPQYRIAASLPAAANDVLSVAAIDKTARVAAFSNAFARVAAPGVNIESAWIGKGLETISGTSMACPHVAGLAALWAEAIIAGGGTPTASNVVAKLVAHARKDVFGGSYNEIDFGVGLVTAPE